MDKVALLKDLVHIIPIEKENVITEVVFLLK